VLNVELSENNIRKANISKIVTVVTDVTVKMDRQKKYCGAVGTIYYNINSIYNNK
jgi:hypothetical protein